MRSFDVPTSKAKLKLLDAAELLVSKNGFDAVSVRDVTQLAKANVAAVNYHFGSREGMMGLMMVRRMSPIHHEQLQRLNILEKKRGSKALILEDLLEAWLSPYFSQTMASDEQSEVYRHCMARIILLPMDALPEPLQASGTEVWKRYLKAFSKSLREITSEELAWRLHLLNGGLVQSLLGDGNIHRWIPIDNSDSSVESLLNRLLRLAASMLREGSQQPTEEDAPKPPQGTFDF